MFDKNISWLRDTGIISKMVEDEKIAADVHTTSKLSENQPLTVMRYVLIYNYLLLLPTLFSPSIPRLSPALVLWCGGIVMASTVFILEKLTLRSTKE